MTYLSFKDGNKENNSSWKIRSQGIRHFRDYFLNKILISFESVEWRVYISVFPASSCWKKSCLAPNVLSSWYSEYHSFRWHEWCSASAIPSTSRQKCFCSKAMRDGGVAQQFFSSQECRLLQLQLYLLSTRFIFLQKWGKALCLLFLFASSHQTAWEVPYFWPVSFVAYWSIYSWDYNLEGVPRQSKGWTIS